MEMTAADDAWAIIDRLGLAPHPEGGWFRETWREPGLYGARASATAIWFLLEAGQRSHWHRVDAAEMWFWHAGAPRMLSITERDAAQPLSRLLGGDVLGGALPHYLVPAGYWQATGDADGWTLFSCVVSPGFDFAGFELAAPGWMPGAA
jgi:predicted cupin superfamily sugar epimerase